MGSYFPNRWPLSYLNLTKNMKTYIRRQQHKKFFKHQDIKQKEPPQKYRLGTISNTKLLAGLNRDDICKVSKESPKNVGGVTHTRHPLRRDLRARHGSRLTVSSLHGLPFTANPRPKRRVQTGEDLWPVPQPPGSSFLAYGYPPTANRCHLF